MNTADARRILETALICAQEPMTLRDMSVLFEGAVSYDTLRAMLADLQQAWTHKGVELVCLASGWRFQSRPELRPFLDRLHPEKPPKYSRATMETLAIIAYRQPVTRGDMEDIRGVTINSTILKQLEDRGWIEVIGHRETVGRPGLYATTRQFLDDLGLASLDALPALDVAALPADALGMLDFEAPVSDEPVGAPVNGDAVPPASAPSDVQDLFGASLVEDAAETEAVVQAPADDLLPPEGPHEP